MGTYHADLMYSHDVAKGRIIHRVDLFFKVSLALSAILDRLLNKQTPESSMIAMAKSVANGGQSIS